MKKSFILLLFIVNLALGQSVTLQPGSTGYIAIPTISTLPSVTTADKGKVIFLTTDNKFYFCNGTVWSDPSLTLPFSTSGNLSGDLFWIINNNSSSTSVSKSALRGDGYGMSNGVMGITDNASTAVNHTGVYGWNIGLGSLGQGVLGVHGNLGIGVRGSSNDGTGGQFNSVNGYGLKTTGKLQFGGNGVGAISSGKVLKAIDSFGNAEWGEVLNFPYSFSGSSLGFPFVPSLFEIVNTATPSGSTAITGTVTGGAAGLKGVYGKATNSAPTSNNFGVFASNESTNGVGVGLWAEHYGTGTAGVLSCNNGTALQTFGGLRFGGNGVGTISAGKVLKAINSNGDAQWSDVLSFPYSATGGGTFPIPTFQITNNNTASGSTAIKGIGRVGVHGEATEVSPTIPNWGVRAYNLATNSLGFGIEATHSGGGIGGLFSSNSGTAGYFTSTSGYSIITGAGNVGIGNSTPNAPLQFSNALGNRKLVIYEAANNDHQFYGIGLNSGVFRYQVDGTSSNHIFYAATSASASNELMRITGLGRVGVGVASPDQILDVNGRARIRHNVNSAGIWMSNSTNSTLSADGAFYGMKTDTEAGIWIGNNWRFWINNAGNMTVGGTVTASCGVLVCSDLRYKRNITSLNNSLDNILKISGVRYDFKKEEFPEKNFTDKSQIGFIAQEIEKVFPEMVMTDVDGYKSVDYARLTPVLVEAMKEQQKMIEELKTKNEKLELNNQKLESRLEKIEVMLNK
ncbi:MAG: tail fiber domain-containing protein [Spirosomataceae bacterium]